MAKKKVKRGWFIFTASHSYFCKMTDGQMPPPLLAGETARIEWSGKNWPKPLERRKERA